MKTIAVLRYAKIILSLFFFLMSVRAVAQVENQSVFPEPAQVESKQQLKAHVGVLAGVNSLDGSGYDASPSLAIDTGLQPYIPFGMGAEIDYSKNRARLSGEEDLERITALLKGTYNFGGDITLLSKSYVGVVAGAIFANDRRTDVVSGPLVGFDLPMVTHSNDMVSAGLQMKYLVISGSEPDALIASAAFKYWF